MFLDWFMEWPSAELSSAQKFRYCFHWCRLKFNQKWNDLKYWIKSWWAKPKGAGEPWHTMPPEKARPTKWKEYFETFHGWTDPEVIAGGGDGIIVAFKQPFVMKVPHFTPLAWQIFSELQEQQQQFA